LDFSKVYIKDTSGFLDLSGNYKIDSSNNMLLSLGKNDKNEYIFETEKI